MFKNRQLAILFLIVLLDVVVGSATGPVRPEFVKDLSNPEWWLSVGTALFLGVQLVSAPLLGKLSDSLGRKPLVLVSGIGTLAANLLLIPVKAGFFFANRVSDGLTNGMYALMRSSVTDLSPEEELAKNSGYISTLVSLGHVFGPMVAGVALFFVNNKADQARLVVWVLIGLSLLNIGVSLLMSETAKHRSKVDWRAVRQEVGNNLNVARLWHRLSDKDKEHPGFRFLTILMLLATLQLGHQTYFITYLALSPMQFDAQQISFFFVYFGGLSALSNLLYFKYFVNRVDKRTVLIITVFIGVAMQLIFANLGTSKPLLYAAVAVDAILVSLVTGLLNGFLAKLTTDEDRGELFGLNQALTGIASLVTTLVYGGLATINLNLPFYWFAASLAVLGTLCWKLPKGV
ncbi:MFS transporter [Fibrella aquatica]|uniref:MFS transporter n=1 Tax=Fibrella aquatica TaxID=3242487 RepID=UPI00352182D9